MANDIQDQLGRVRDFAEDKSGLAIDRLKGGVTAARESATEALETGKDIAAHAFEAGKDTAEKAYIRGKNTAFDLSDKANRIFQEHPLTAVAAAVAAGAVIASVLPSGARKNLKSGIGRAPKMAAAFAHSVKDAASVLAETAGKSASAVRVQAVRTVESARDAVDTDELKSEVQALATRAGATIAAAGKSVVKSVRKKPE